MVTHAPGCTLTVEETREFRPAFDAEGWLDLKFMVVPVSSPLRGPEALFHPSLADAAADR